MLWFLPPPPEIWLGRFFLFTFWRIRRCSAWEVISFKSALVPMCEEHSSNSCLLDWTEYLNRIRPGFTASLAFLLRENFSQMPNANFLKTKHHFLLMTVKSHKFCPWKKYEDTQPWDVDSHLRGGQFWAGFEEVEVERELDAVNVQLEANSFFFWPAVCGDPPKPSYHHENVSGHPDPSWCVW